jgi:hypothetical protein
LSLAAGVGFSPLLPNDIYSNKAEVQDMVQHDAAVTRVKTLGDDLIVGQLRLNLAGDVLGKNRASSPAGFENQLQQYTVLRDDQKARALAFRNEIIMNPALSEREAKDLYASFVDKAVDHRLWRDALNETFTFEFKPFIYRDECRAENAKNLLPEESAAKISACAHSKVVQRDEKEVQGMLMNFAGTSGTFAGFLGLSFLAGSLRRRQDKSEKSAAQAILPEPLKTPKPPEVKPPTPVEKPAKKDLEF